MKRALISTSVVALVSSAAIAFAQSPGGDKQGPGGGQPAPSMQQDTGGRSSGAGPNAQSQGPNSEQAQPGGGPQAEDRDRASPGKQAAPAGGDDRSTPTSKQAGSNDKGPNGKPAGPNDNGSSGKKTGTKEGGSNNGDTAESRRDKSGGQSATDTNKAGSSNQSADRNRNDQQHAADQNKDRDRGGKDKVQISSEQKTKIKSAFKREDFDRARTDIHINVAIGTALPRSVHLYPVPDYVIAIEPEYASFEYVVIDGQLCIVDPATYEIVTVIDRGPRVAGYKREGGGHDGAGASLTLTDQEKTFILEHVDMDKFRAGSDISIDVGQALPGSVELFAFPDVVVSEIPKVKEFKFVVVEGDILIAQPSDGDVVLRIKG